MEKAPEFLKSNDHHLKFCILYEVALNKPIFDSYGTFCDAVGPDAMEYRDFEFWYHRFCLGELDFDYDRSMDPVPKTLMDMPVKLMRKITEELDPFESKRHDNKLDWRFNGNEYECKKEGSGCTFSRPKCLNIERSNECSFRQRNKIKVTETYDKCFIKKSLEYVTPLFQIPKLQTDHLSFVLKNQSPDLDNLLTVPFHAKSAYIVAYSFDKMFQLLSTMKAGFLESFNLELEEPTGREQFRKVFKTDQFKQAQIVHLPRIVKFNVKDLVNFSHLRQFSCGLKTIVKPTEILRIRNIVSKFKDLNVCRIIYQTNVSPIRQLAEALDVEAPVWPVDRFTHRYISKSKETLEFTIFLNARWCYIDIRKVR
ncbi:hypothetical protein B9Z55_027020 [Caenorhabditis nigoni]|uniref:Mos1 transposase HTH domain-containing protein n=1 Tax=Caenorhabditis nigoni TaxID=1611254 RepID=A0A2G5SIX1_9PELO|nr:hypothetical protein B9Z55_027020 [Caenorhabditis nigoni]